MVYRYSYVRMFYSYEDANKGYTPSPFAEFRIFLISKNKIFNSKKIFEVMKDGIEFMEWIFISMMVAVLQKKVYWEIMGKEEQYIDNDEAILDLNSTGIRYPKPDQFYRYVRFIKQQGEDKEFNEADIRKIEIARMKIPKLTLVTLKDLSQYVEQNKAFWKKISFKQYLYLKKYLKIP